MHVRTACQILSQSVSTGMKLFIALGLLPEEAQWTADFCDKLDRLFNCFNSSSKFSVWPLGGAISKHSAHWEFLASMKVYLTDLKPVGRASLPCVDGFLSNIAALPLIFKKLTLTMF